MPKLYPVFNIIKQVIGGLNFKGRADAGIDLARTTLEGTFASITSAVGVTRTVLDGVVGRAQPGIDLVATRTGDHAKEPVHPSPNLDHAGLQDPSFAVASQQITSGTDVPLAGLDDPSFAVRSQEQNPALDMELNIVLDRRTWVDVASESAASDWNDLANSEGDSTDTAVASLSEGLVLTQGTLIGDFPDPTGKTELTIDRVRLQCHYRVQEFLLAGTTLQVQYRIGALGVPTTLRTVTGGITSPTNVNFLTNGELFDITADRAWTWQDSSDIQVLYTGTILVDAGLSAVQVNATKLLIEASLTEEL